MEVTTSRYLSCLAKLLRRASLNRILFVAGDDIVASVAGCDGGGGGGGGGDEQHSATSTRGGVAETIVVVVVVVIGGGCGDGDTRGTK